MIFHEYTLNLGVCLFENVHILQQLEIKSNNKVTDMTINLFLISCIPYFYYRYFVMIKFSRYKIHRAF